MSEKNSAFCRGERRHALFSCVGYGRQCAVLNQFQFTVVEFYDGCFDLCGLGFLLDLFHLGLHRIQVELHDFVLIVDQKFFAVKGFRLHQDIPRKLNQVIILIDDFTFDLHIFGDVFQAVAC